MKRHADRTAIAGLVLLAIWAINLILAAPSRAGEDLLLACPPYTDWAVANPDGTITCSVSSGESLTIPDTATETPAPMIPFIVATVWIVLIALFLFMLGLMKATSMVAPLPETECTFFRDGRRCSHRECLRLRARPIPPKGF
jgi:hypothetical protein